MDRTRCCVVGAGPAGAMLALLLARLGIAVTLLEGHADFEREFRGDTLHPSTLDLLDDLGLADRLLALPHTKVSVLTLQARSGPLVLADFRRLPVRHPYIALLPQARFLEFITEEASTYPGFDLRMQARVDELVREDGVVRGVRYRTGQERHEVRALLTVAADGRASTVRRLAGLEPRRTSPPMDVLWFRVPRGPGDAAGTFGRVGGGHILVVLDRQDHWQVGYVIPKGSYRQLREEGLEALGHSVAQLAPELAPRVGALTDWKQVSLLSVESSRLRRWYQRGLLFIGDAAHVMSPVGGVGINYAIQDALVAAEVLEGPLRAGRMSLRDLAEVQRRREWPVRLIQALQALVQRALLAPALERTSEFDPPAWVRLLPHLPVIRDVPGRLIAYGLAPTRPSSRITGSEHPRTSLD